MKKEVISTSEAPSAIGPYSQGIKAGNLIFTSGQLPIDPKTGELVNNVEEATAQSLKNLKAILEAAGSSLDMIVKTVIFLRDMNDFAAVNKVYGTFFAENPPARSTVQVACLPKGAVLEIEAIAMINE